MQILLSSHQTKRTAWIVFARFCIHLNWPWDAGSSFALGKPRLPFFIRRFVESLRQGFCADSEEAELVGFTPMWSRRGRRVHATFIN